MATTTYDLNALLTALGSGSTGINVSSAVSAAVYTLRAPERQWQAQQTVLAYQKNAINQINTLASTLSDSLYALSDPGGAVATMSASSSMTNVVTSSAVPGTSAGSHVVKVANLASTASWYSDALSSSSTPLSAGSFSLQVGSGATTNIAVGGTTGINTLSQLASYINGKNLGVNASVVTDATGSRLAIVSQNSGSASDITISDVSGLAFTQAVQGKNASLTVDGIPISSATNSVTGAVNGLTLNLQSAAPDTEVNVSIAPDATSITKAVNDFVDSYNSMLSYVSAQFKYDTTNQTSGPLGGDSNTRALQSQLLGAASFTSSGSISTLGALGISMGDDGTLTVNSATLASAIQNNVSAVQQFFQGTASNGFANALNKQLDVYTDPTQGAFTLELKSIQSQTSDLQDHITNFEVYVTSQQAKLQDEYSKADVLLQQLPNTMNQINTLLGYNTKNG